MSRNGAPRRYLTISPAWISRWTGIMPVQVADDIDETTLSDNRPNVFEIARTQLYNINSSGFESRRTCIGRAGNVYCV